MSPFAARSRLLQGIAVLAAFVGGSGRRSVPRRDAFDCRADDVRYRREGAPPTGGGAGCFCRRVRAAFRDLGAMFLVF